MHERMCTRTCVTIAMAGWLHGFCVGACWVISPQGGFSLSLFCRYKMRTLRAHAKKAILSQPPQWIKSSVFKLCVTDTFATLDRRQQAPCRTARVFSRG